MPGHRFLDLLNAEALSEPVVVRSPILAGFVLYPVTMPWQAELYQRAFEQARAVVRPSLLETRLAPSRN